MSTNVKEMLMLLHNYGYTLKDLCDLINATDNISIKKEEGIEEKVTKRLLKLGFNPNLQGFRYLRSAIIKVYNDSKVMKPVTQKLYPALASEYGSSDKKVERCMRSAIISAFKKGAGKFFEGTVEYKKGAPTCSQFISAFVEQLRIEEK